MFNVYVKETQKHIIYVTKLESVVLLLNRELTPNATLSVMIEDCVE